MRIVSAARYLVLYRRTGLRYLDALNIAVVVAVAGDMHDDVTSP